MTTLKELHQTVNRINEAGQRLVAAMRRAGSEPQIMECDQCGHVVPGRSLRDDPTYWRCSLAARNPDGPWGESEPAEYVTICPECGAEESFEEAMTCGQCFDYPCTCF